MSKPTDKTTTSQGCAPQDVIFGITEIEGGFPHSEICGSKVVRTSPQLIAAYHVLHRLSAPRHPPDTLIALDRSHYRCPSHVPHLGRGGRAIPFSPSGESRQGLDLKDQFCFKHIRERRSGCVHLLDACCEWIRQNPKAAHDPVATTGYVHSSRCQISAWSVSDQPRSFM